MNKNVPKYLIIHHCGGTDLQPLFDSSNQTFAQVNEAHRLNSNVNLGYPSSLGYYIGYHYFIDKTGLITQGRTDSDEGAHTRGYNLQSLGICLAGNFDLTLPNEVQIASLKRLMARLSDLYQIPFANILPHRHFAAKTCYGRLLADSWAADLLRNYSAVPSPCTTERETIADQAAQISKFKSFIQSVKALIDKLI